MIKKKIIEEKLSIKEINLDSIMEASFKTLPRETCEEYKRVFGVKPMVVGSRPRNIHTWFARRPTSPARFTTLYSVLPLTKNENDGIE